MALKIFRSVLKLSHNMPGHCIIHTEGCYRENDRKTIWILSISMELFTPSEDK